VAQLQQPNPLDAMFFAIDEAWRRCGQPGAEIHWYFELRGRLDVAGLRRAVRALHRLYPTTQARLARTALTGRSAWRLDVEPPDLERVVEVRQLTPPTEAELHRQIELLLATRLDLKRLPPLHFVVFRGLPAGDFLIMRWPHALMDAHSGATVVEKLARLYDEDPDPETLASVGDERRTDFGALRARTPFSRCLATLLGRRDEAARPRGWHDIRLCPASLSGTDARMRFYDRGLSPERWAQIRTIAMQICGFARVGDFVRACAIRALHEVAGHRAPANHGYSTMQLIDSRKPRDPGPVCHNVFSTMPVFVPATMAGDRRAVADLVQETTVRMLTSGARERRLAGLQMLAPIPTGILAGVLERELRTGKSLLPVGLSSPPSLPMTFMNLLSRPLKSFCNAELISVFGTRPGVPPDGLVVNVSTAQERMHISGIHFEPWVTRDLVNEFLDRFVAALTDPS
jgi:hypothetical protein